MKKTEKFCYYNNYNFFQPRHFCKSCRRYWTHGGTLRDIPVGGGSHKNAKRSRITSHTMSSTSSQDPLSATPVLVPLGSKHGSSVQFGLGGNGGGSDKGNVNVCGTFTSLMNAPHNHRKMKKTGKSYKPNGKSEERKDRKSRTSMNGLPKKRGHEGKFTWVGDGYSQPEIGFESRGVFDVKDPNFEDPDETFTV